nr:DnaB-like helicase C-terminal domain-containing protein [Brevundimonas sp. BAL450]
MTGLRCFDRRLGGLHPGRLLLIGGRPSMGKTGLARAGAVGCARRNSDRTVIFYSQEMDREELDHRSLAQFSFEEGHGIPYFDMTAPDPLAPDVLDRLDRLRTRAPANLWIDDSPVLTVEYVRRRTLAMVRKRPVAAIFIDYLQIMRRPDSRNSNDAAVLGQMTAALKQLAREAKCCVVLLSQLSRKVEERENKRPNLSDLRESGAIEQDANHVLFCYRDAYYLEREGPRKGESEAEHSMRLVECEATMEVITAKNRGGPIGTDRQRYLAKYDVVQDEGDWS